MPRRECLTMRCIAGASAPYTRHSLVNAARDGYSDRLLSEGGALETPPDRLDSICQKLRRLAHGRAGRDRDDVVRGLDQDIAQFDYTSQHPEWVWRKVAL